MSDADDLDALAPASYRAARAAAARRLRASGLSYRRIAERLRCAPDTARRDVGAADGQLGRDDLAAMSDSDIEAARRDGRLDRLMGRDGGDEEEGDDDGRAE